MRALLFIAALLPGLSFAAELRGTGDMGVVVERATGSLLIVDQSERAAIGRVEGLGDLSHASVVFSPDERFAYVFGRDGGLSKVDGADGDNKNGQDEYDFWCHSFLFSCLQDRAIF